MPTRPATTRPSRARRGAHVLRDAAAAGMLVAACALQVLRQGQLLFVAFEIDE